MMGSSEPKGDSPMGGIVASTVDGLPASADVVVISGGGWLLLIAAADAA